MKSIILSFTLFIALALTANALNILAIFPYHGTSHFLVFRVYLLGLVNKGHNVTVISHFPEKNPPPNYHSVSLAGTLAILKDEMPIEKSYKTIFNTVLFLTFTGKENCVVMLKNKKVRDLIKSKQKFDVIVVEQFNSDCAFGIAYKLNAPVVGMMSHILMPWHYRRLGIPHNTAYVPFHFLEGGTKPTLYQRIERAVFDVIFRTLYYFVTQRSDQNTLAKYFDDIPPLEDLAREMKFLLLYHNFVLTGSRLFPANVIEVGGYHVASAKPLAGALKAFVEEAKHGVVYISFGSLVSASSLSPEKVQAILDVMAALPQRFIWKWNNKTLGVAQDKLYTGSWLPQIDILGHPKTLAFFSHAGMGGTTEAIHFGVPMVAMPVLGDQPANGASIEESGLGVQVQIRDLNKENLLTAFRKVLDPKMCGEEEETMEHLMCECHALARQRMKDFGTGYPDPEEFKALPLSSIIQHMEMVEKALEFREKMKQISKAWHDRPMQPLDTAIYWTEYAARHSNFTFRAAAADTPMYQHLYLDIIGVLFISLYVITKICSFLASLCKSKPGFKSVKTNDKKASKKSKRE